jgi:ribosome-associated toxin RatA of RatAB toxin-antitoxin module
MRFLFPGVRPILAILPTILSILPLEAKAEVLPKTSYWNSLGENHHDMLNSGRPVILEEEIPGNPWPRFTIYQLVKAKPAHVAAVFWDCEKDPEYIPNCTKVSILSRPAPNVVEAEYTLKMPFLIPDEIYVSRNQIRRGPDGGYEVSWKVLNSRYTKSCSGTLRLEDHDGGTLIRYSNLVEPGSRIAKLLKASASRQVVESVQSLVDRVGDLLVRPGNVLEREIRLLEGSLGPAADTPPAR